MTDVRTRQLRFTIRETATFLNELMALGLFRNEVATVAVRSEDWIDERLLDWVEGRG